MGDIEDLTKLITEFRDARNWKQFHNPKDMALSLVLEAGEVMEHFQWLNKSEMKEHVNKHKEEVAIELADVLYWILLMSHDMNIDIKEAFKKKMKLSTKKYPVEKSKNSHKKYTEL